MDFLESSGVRHARTVFAICAFIVVFFLLVPVSEQKLLAAPFRNEGHWGAIISVALLIIVFPVLASMTGWNLDQKTKTTVEKVVVIEGMSDPSDSFCSTYKSKPLELEKQCELLSTNSKETCTSADCCGWLTVKKDYGYHSHCVAIDESGFPVHSHNEDGSKRDMIHMSTKKSETTSFLKEVASDAKEATKDAVDKIEEGTDQISDDVKKMWNDI